MAIQQRTRQIKAFRLKRKAIRSVIFGMLGIAIVAEIVVLSPSSLEESKTASTTIDTSALALDNEPTLIPDIPTDRIAEYSIEVFKYVSIQNSVKQWRVEAERAFMFNPERLVHARVVHAFLYDPEGKITTITGKEARYFMNKRDLEVYGDVLTVFPDGFSLHSEYLRYRPNENRITIPTTYAVQGSGRQSDDQVFEFKSMGLDYSMGSAKILLPKAAQVTLMKEPSRSSKDNSKDNSTAGVPDKTTIDSDQCFIDRSKNLAHFTMDPKRPLKTRFVHITQPTLFARSRRAELNYGDFNKVLQYMTAFEDVLIKETERKDGKASTQENGKKKKNAPPSLRYATAGRADFDTRDDTIVLTQLPQAYQNQDTVTGDVILMHRDSDIIEVEHGNSFSQGE